MILPNEPMQLGESLDQRLFDKLPPHSLPAEQCLIGSMMLDEQLADEVIADLSPAAFYLADHMIIFRIIADMRRADKPCDAVILREELIKRGELDEIGGVAYLAEILNTVPSASNGLHYAEVVRQKYQLRQTISITNEALRNAYAAGCDPVELASETQAKLANLVGNTATDAVISIGDAMAKEVEELYDPSPRRLLRTYFAPVDDEIGGIGEGEIMLIGARPSMGKSTIMRQMAVSMAENGQPLLYVSLEENDAKISRNVFAWKCQVENHLIRQKKLTPEQLKSMYDVAQRAKEWPLHIVRHVFDADRIYSLASAYKSKDGIRGLMIDYLQLIKAGGKDEFERATKASHAVVHIARSLGLSTVCASQLSRANTQREDKRPTMTDLRQSGQIEQDADIILLLHREDYYHLDDQSYVKNRQAELIKAKFRDGERGNSIILKSSLAYQCFEPMPEVVPEFL